MDTKRVWIVILVVAACLLLVNSAFSAPPTIKWKGQTAYATINDHGPFPVNRAGAASSPYMLAEWLNRETKGQFQLNIAPMGSIVPVTQMYQAVKAGALDFGGLYYGGFHAGVMPETDIEIGLPFAWEKPEEAWDAYFNRGLYKEIQAVYAEHGLYWIPSFCNSTYGFAGNFPIPNPEAIKGKKFRASGFYGEIVKQMGGVPVVVTPAEMYMALKLGTIDGTIFAMEYLESAKLKEVWKNYVVTPNLNTVIGSYIVNLNSFKKLPADIRAMFDNNVVPMLLENTMNNKIWDMYWGAKAEREVPTFKMVHWSAADTAKVRKIGFGTWDTVAAKSPRNARLVEIVRKQMRELGKME